MDNQASTQLILMVTLGCNSGCAHCCLACSPRKLNLSMTEDEIVSYIQQAYDYGIRSVCFSGGEPLLLDLRAPMDLADSLHMFIDIRTNAFWADDPSGALSVLQYLQFLGLSRLGLSYDSYHAKFIPPSHITNALAAARELYLPVYLDWVGLQSYEQVLAYLHLSEDELRYVGTPLKVGSAVQLGYEHFNYIPAEEVHLACEDDRLLTIFPGGYASLHPCCWVNPALLRRVGSNGWIKELDEEMAYSPAVAFLAEHGVEGLIERAQRERPDAVKSHYSHPCEACYDLLGLLFPAETIALPSHLTQGLKELSGVAK